MILLPRLLFAALFAFVCATATLAAPTDENQVIVPKPSSLQPVSPNAGTPGGGVFTMVAVLLLAGAGGWFLWRGRSGKSAMLGRAAQQLTIEETRSLGSRQYLVVASYQDKKFLLGVCPGRIDLLAPLHDGADAAPLPVKERP